MLQFINYHSLLMEWKLLIHFNDKSDGIFQINQHPSKILFCILDERCTEKECVSQLCGFVFMGRAARCLVLTLTI